VNLTILIIILQVGSIVYVQYIDFDTCGTMLKIFGLDTTVEETAKILMRTDASSTPFIYFWYLQLNA
jgi:hypothetical protein